MAKRIHQVRVAEERGSRPVYATSDDYGWLTAEAERRGVTRAQVVRDALRAYRKLVKDSAPYDNATSNKIHINF